jgi:hypothetical protein
LAYAFWGWSYVLFKIVYAVADHPADGKALEVDGLFQGFHDLMKEDRYVSRDHPLELFF